MNENVARWYMPTFADRLYRCLTAPKELGLELQAGERCFRVKGLLPLFAHDETGLVTVPLELIVYPPWMSVPPRAFVRAHFIRQEIDWHVLSDGSLCYVHPREWVDQLAKNIEDSGDISATLESAGLWCLASVDSLAVRHLLGNRLGISHWPKAWDQYSHFEAGMKEYEATKSARIREMIR